MDLNELENRLRGHAQNTIEKIESPFNLKMEINKMERNEMNKSKNITWIKRLATIAAIVCLCIVTVAMANPEKGFFKDVQRFDGAIVGTEYVNAQNDVTFKVIKDEDEEGNVAINVEMEFVNKETAPFAYIQEIAIPEYKVVNEKGEEIVSVKNILEDAEKATVEDGKVSMQLLVSKNKLLQTTNEIYFIEIESIYGLAKAEQPLKINGGWNLKF